MQNNARQIDAVQDENSIAAPARRRTTPTARAKAESAFRTISEVSETLKVPQHVLRFWETKFTQIRPLKRGGGRRYYRPEDVALLVRVHELLYSEGYTIKGVQKLLKGQGKIQIVAQPRVVSAPEPIAVPADSLPEVFVEEAVPPIVEVAPATDQQAVLRGLLDELKELRQLIRG